MASFLAFLIPHVSSERTLVHWEEMQPKTIKDQTVKVSDTTGDAISANAGKQNL